MIAKSTLFSPMFRSRCFAPIGLDVLLEHSAHTTTPNYLRQYRYKTAIRMLDGCGRSRFVAIFLGIDGGGSQTACLVGDETSVLATATSGPSNVVRVGEQRAREALHESISAACA